MKNIYSIVLVCLAMSFSFAQNGWDWPTDADLKSKAMEKQAYYKLLMAQKKYPEALNSLRWLYDNNAKLNKSIYIDGADCLKNMIKSEEDRNKKQVLKDSLLWMFDQRIAHFNRAKAIDRKAYEAFKLYYKTPKKYALLADFFESTYKENKEKVGNYNLNTYMMLASNYHKFNPTEMPAEKVLDIYTLISETIEKKLANGGDAERLKKEQSKTDGFLGSVGKILSCEYIEEQLVPKFRENPSDISSAKKIFKYSVKAKCTDKPYFMEASETVYKNQPSAALANAMANRYLANKDYDKASTFQEEAFKLATTDDERHDAKIGQAVIASKQGAKSKARSLAYEALKFKAGSSEAYNLIGNLYFYSFKSCRGNKSRVKDRSVYVAAYNMYQKAGNKSMMKTCKSQFPSMENIFSEGYTEGQSVNTGCWINENVKIMKR